MSWHIETHSMGAVVIICNDKGHPIARMVDNQDYANAALIAAAPDLLKACQNMLACCYDMERNDETLAAVKSTMYAIAKATNQTN